MHVIVIDVFLIDVPMFPLSLVKISQTVKKWQPCFEIQDGGGRQLFHTVISAPCSASWYDWHASLYRFIHDVLTLNVLCTSDIREFCVFQKLTVVCSPVFTVTALVVLFVGNFGWISMYSSVQLFLLVVAVVSTSKYAGVHRSRNFCRYISFSSRPSNNRRTHDAPLLFHQ